MKVIARLQFELTYYESSTFTITPRKLPPEREPELETVSETTVEFERERERGGVAEISHGLFKTKQINERLTSVNETFKRTEYTNKKKITFTSVTFQPY